MSSTPPQHPHRPILIALIVSCAFFMQQLDGTVIATALPQMAQSFHDTPVNVSVGMTAYLLTLAVFIPASGWMADRFGSRTVFGGAILLFTAGSVLCGISLNLWEFTLARILQAVGGAMMVPVGRLVVLRSVKKNELIRSMQFVTIPGLVAPVLGPPLGGFITTYASWRWIFFLNIPLGLVGIVLVAIFMQNHRSEERRRFDVLGFLLSGIGLACLMYGVTALGRAESSVPIAIASIVLGGVLVVLAFVHVSRTAHPLLDLSILKLPNFNIATVWGGSLFRLTIGSTPFLWPLMFQTSFGMSAFHSGVLMSACTGGDLAMQAFTRQSLRRFGFRNVLLVNGFLSTAGIFACVAFSAAMPSVVIALVLLWIGICRSLQFTSLHSLAYVDIPPEQMGSATSLASTIQQLSVGTGVAFGAFALHAAALTHGGGDSYTVSDFRVAYILVGLSALASTLNFFRLSPAAGAEASGHRGN